MSTAEQQQSVSFIVTEPSRTPWTGIVLGYAAMLPIAAGALGAALLPPPLAIVSLEFAMTWAAAVVIFLAGVRRGLSFRTAGGETTAQIVTMFWLFCVGVAALFALMLLALRTSVVLLILGYLTLAVFDPIAARRGEAPLFFARLRPVQMLVPLLSLALILWLVLS
ncbi:MAG: DUF3429 family protein [Gluconacetobacter diazotrophicus]|nr:DUF3429 family protein [Gluconacetobacter diazotrophicus]